uniref:Fibronectin type-III domain-containing protein n=1 Tax=Geobacter sp. (strain M21) TaxID=443144 RepID=C6E157_GEOSM
MPKPKTSFPKKAPELLVLSRKVKESLYNGPLFQQRSSEFEQDLQKLSEGIDRLQKASDESQTRDSLKIAFRDKTREEVNVILGRVVKHVELTAHGDLAVLQSSGFELTQDKSKKPPLSSQPLPAPIVTLKHGRLSGTLIANAKPVPGAASYEFRITDSDPTISENFSSFGTFAHGTHITIPDRTPGRTYSVIARCIGTAGPGVWSSPFTLMSL